MEESLSPDPDPEQIQSLLGLVQLGWTEFLVPLGSIVLLLTCSGLISASEVAYFSLSRAQLDELVQSNLSGNKRIIKLVKQPKELLAAILILNNLINVAIVMISTILLWNLTGSKDAEGLIIGITTIGITVLIVFFGEITPKVYASQNQVQVARITSGILVLSGVLFKPLIWFLLKTTSLIERRFNVKGYKVTRDALEQALEITSDESTTEEEKEILKGILNFSSVSVRQIMKSRLDVVALDVDSSFLETLKMIQKEGYSRIPVFKETIDNIQGILYIKDLIPHLKKDSNFYWQSLIRKPFFVPESKKIDDLLRNFQNRRVHMAIVVDEYGGTAGLVTLEDVIEEIVGEFNDEFDNESPLIKRINDRTYTVEGKISLYDFCKALNIEESIFEAVRGESDSLGGLLLELFSKFPKPGDQTSYGGYTFMVVSADRKKINRIKVTEDQEVPDAS